MLKELLKRNMTAVILGVILLFSISACSDDNTNNTPDVSETLELIKYLEGQELPPSPYMNNIPFTIKAEAVYPEVADENDKWTIIDLRAAKDFNDGHIKGSVNVTMADLLNYYKTNNLSAQDKVVIVSYTGQSSAYATSALRLSGYINPYSMKWGMSAWNKAADKWTENVSNQGADSFEKSKRLKPGETSYPVLNTGKTTGKEIAEASVTKVLSEGFDIAKISADVVLADPDKYFIICYWPELRYEDPGHIKGAYNYQPKTLKDCDLLSTTFLKTLPPDKTIVIYCYSGQTSAFAAAYLRVLGYDAKTLLYGANDMIYDILRAKGWGYWHKDKYSHDFELVK
jgi:rhodanese-related sulfurtransferase